VFCFAACTAQGMHVDGANFFGQMALKKGLI